jgi:transcriptional regulator with XRE-family HTH domain/Zn-dependent peptidase ImmA (M78 family)
LRFLLLGIRIAAITATASAVEIKTPFSKKDLRYPPVFYILGPLSVTQHLMKGTERVEDPKKIFGEFVRNARIKAGFSLRAGARQIGFAPEYLSRVEAGTNTPSPKMIAAMSKEFNVPVDRLVELLPHTRAGVHGHVMERRPDLRALYRVASTLDPSEVDDFLRKFLREKRNLQDDQVEELLRDLKDELPRLRRGSEGLFAAEVRPPVLSRQRITEIAEQFLARHGLTRSTYVPPTPIERLVELEPDIRLRVRSLDRKTNGKPYVLGLSRWDADGNKEIVLNTLLVESEDETSEHRMLFTLGHELFHALRHLPLITAAMRIRGECCRVSISDLSLSNNKKKTAAQRAIQAWQNSTSPPRKLFTAEDWREWQSQTFSAAVLMPSWAVKKEFTNRTQREALKSNDNVNSKKLALAIATETVFGSEVFEKPLNQLFKVSAQAMAIRLLTLKLVM